MDMDDLIAAREREQQAALEQRAGFTTEQRGILAAVEAEGRSALSETEQARFDELSTLKDGAAKRAAELGEKVTALKAERAADAAIDAAHQERTPGAALPKRAPATIGAEPETYRKGGQTSYFRDLWMAQQYGRTDARDRLERNNREVQARALSTTDGAGGDFVPPLWLVDEFVTLARPGRVVANQLTPKPLPAGTDVISLPRVATGTATAAQGTQNTSFQNTDATTDSVSAAVHTIGGGQTVSVQLVEQSPINIDEVILGDLAADYAQRIDEFAINSNATNKLGLLNVVGLNAVAYTDATPTVPEIHPKLVDATVRIGSGIFRPAQKIFMTLERWGWFLAALDAQNRPFVTTVGAMPANALGLSEGAVSEGFAGIYNPLNLPVYLDPNIPKNLGAGTNEDRIIAARTDEIFLYESTPKAEAFRETRAESGGIYFRLYGYAAIHASRRPKAISVISGTGLIAPTF